VLTNPNIEHLIKFLVVTIEWWWLIMLS
jgi:hypothetical protein